MGGVHWDVDVVQAEGQQDLIYLARADGPNVVNGIRLVGTIEVLGGFIGTAIQRMVLLKSEVYAAEPQALVFGQGYVHGQGIFPLVLRVLRRKKPVSVTVDWRGEIWYRIPV